MAWCFCSGLGLLEIDGTKTMTWIHMLSAAISALLMIYLLIALVLPERFS
jgi:K+-transporting ATPase KdpF subunit